jgi:hypothetical protein
MKRLLSYATSVFLVLLLLTGFCVLAAFLASGTEGSGEYDVVESITISVPQEITVTDEMLVADRTSEPTQQTLKTQLQTTTRRQDLLSVPQQQQTLPGNMVPHASFLSEGDGSSFQRAEGSWSFGNSALSLIGLLEALVAIGVFSYRNRSESSNLFTGSFVLRMFVLLLALISLIATSITSDFDKSAIAFDKMTLPIIILFLMQQVLLLGMRGRKDVVSTDKDTVKHFRAKRRYGD